MNINSDNYFKLVVTDVCNNQCIFCQVNSKPYNESISLADATLELEDLSVENILLTGGDPHTNFRLSKIIDTLISQKKTVAIETNGRFLKDETQVSSLKNNVSHIRVSLHSNKKSLNSYLTKKEQSFYETVQGIKHALKHGIEVRLQTIVTRSNLRNMTGIAKFIFKYDIKIWYLQYPQKIGRAEQLNFDTFLAATELLVAYIEKLCVLLQDKCEIILVNFPDEIQEKIGLFGNISKYYSEKQYGTK